MIEKNMYNGKTSSSLRRQNVTFFAIPFYQINVPLATKLVSQSNWNASVEKEWRRQKGSERMGRRRSWLRRMEASVKDRHDAESEFIVKNERIAKSLLFEAKHKINSNLFKWEKNSFFRSAYFCRTIPFVLKYLTSRRVPVFFFLLFLPSSFFFLLMHRISSLFRLQQKQKKKKFAWRQT